MIITGKELLEQENLLETISNGLEREEYQNYDGRIHVSSASYCPRQGALQATYKGTKKVEPQSSLYFKMGIALEESIITSLDKQKQLCGILSLNDIALAYQERNAPGMKADEVADTLAAVCRHQHGSLLSLAS